MKKKHLVGLTIFFSLCLITFACRKEIEYFVHGREKAPSMLVESAKMWHLRNLTTRDPNLRLIPRWNDAWVLKTSKGIRVVTPAPEHHINNPDVSIRRFVIFQVSGNTITDGRIIEFLGEKYNVSGNIDLLLEKYQSDYIPDFTGAVMQYDVNYYPISTKSYTDGVKDKRTVMVVNQKGLTSLQAKSKKNGLREIALSRYPATNPGKKNMSVSGSGCADPYEIVTGIPPGLTGTCTIIFRITIYFDSNDCPSRITYEYLSHTCTSGSGNGSADSGSAGGNGSGSGGPGNGGPPYGGGGGGPQTSRTGDRAPASTPWRDKLVSNDAMSKYLTITNNWFLQNADGTNKKDANGDPIPNLDCYNCHYQAFGPTNDPNRYYEQYTKWVLNPDLTNFEQLPVNSVIKVGDRVSYFVYPNGQKVLKHSGIVTEVDDEGYATKIRSKMGVYDEIEHHPRDIPAEYGPMEPTIGDFPSRIYYRPKN